MASLVEDAAAAAPLPTPPAPATDVDMDKETKMLMHDERSCIFETRIERADLCRQRGSAQFKTGDIDEAVTWYQRALYHVDFDEGTWHFEVCSSQYSTLVGIYSNAIVRYAAIVHAKEPFRCERSKTASVSEPSGVLFGPRSSKGGENDEELLTKVIENANLALAIDPENDKALTCVVTNGDLDGAKEKLTKAAKYHPSDRNICDALSTLKEKLNEHKKVEKERWGGRLLDEMEANGNKTATQQQLKMPVGPVTRCGGSPSC
ncbi:Peptidyl-prolyl cis-trans isomerase, FKBP-type [Phytophthora cactorum]|nr:Peptidyl-prolyl cis-trans isomerase, FKBP-type [Phytophthora cactorum]